MEITSIRTVRKYESRPYWHLVYEWEDVFREQLCCSFLYETQITRCKNYLVRNIHFNPFFCRCPSWYSLRFEMTAKDYPNYYNRKDIIPYIIDFWITPDTLKAFEKAYSNSPFVLISSAEAVAFLHENHCCLKYYHLPLSISDKYNLSRYINFEKRFDLVMFGRQNPVLKEYVLQYSQKHPDFYYAFLKIEDDKYNYYTNKGEYLGECGTRVQGLELLRKSKIGLYATPSLDNGKKFSNGYNQVTPRFLELLACGCHIIARYPQNEDTIFYQLPRFCIHTETYEQFEYQVDFALKTPIDIDFYKKYLSEHYTSVRVQKLLEILKEN